MTSKLLSVFIIVMLLTDLGNAQVYEKPYAHMTFDPSGVKEGYDAKRNPQIYSLTFPEEKDQQIDFLIENIDRMPRGKGSYNYELSECSAGLHEIGKPALPKIRKAFKAALTDENRENQARFLATMLGWLKDESMYEFLALEAIDNKNPRLQAPCLWAICEIDLKRSEPVLAELLYERPIKEDHNVSFMAVYGLTDLHAEEAPGNLFHQRQVWRDLYTARKINSEKESSKLIWTALQKRKAWRIKGETTNLPK